MALPHSAIGHQNSAGVVVFVWSRRGCRGRVPAAARSQRQPGRRICTDSSPTSPTLTGETAHLRAVPIAICILIALTVSITAQPVLTPPHWGDTATYVNIVDIKTRVLSNAIRIIIKADGKLQPWSDPTLFWEREDDEWHQKQVKEFSMALINARSQVGQYVDVGEYPVSHLTLSVPSEAYRGIGLIATLHTYIPASIGKFLWQDRVRDWGRGDDGVQVDMLLSDEKNKLIITVHTEQHRTAEKQEDKGAIRDQERLVVTASERGCSLTARHAPFEDVIRRIALKGNIEIELASGIDRRLTAHLPAMPVSELLEAICDTACLHIHRRNGVQYITPAGISGAAAYWSVPVRKIKLRNICVDEVMGLVPRFMLDHFRPDAESNAIIAHGPNTLLDKIEEDLRRIDNAARQIKVRAMVVEIDDSGAGRSAMNALVSGGDTGLETTPRQGRLRVGIADDDLDHIRTDLKALREEQCVAVKAAPGLTVANGQEASVFVGHKQYYRYLRSTSSGNAVQLGDVDVGISISAQPWTGDGAMMAVPFHMTADRIIGRSENGLPLISRQKLSGNLRIEDGDTIVFGGMRAKTMDRSHRQFKPLLEAFHVVDAPFSSHTRTSITREIIICMSARAITDTPHNTTGDSRLMQGTGSDNRTRSKFTTPSLPGK